MGRFSRNLVALVASFLLPASLAAPTARWNGPGKALYLLDNNPAGSNIIAMTVDEHGMPGHPVLTSTGGQGAISTNSSGDPVAKDSLMSQGSVVVYGNMLFTVNAGCNTVSMFEIDPNDPTHPKLIGRPAPTGGDFPVSIDYSPKYRKACVLNGGANAGVTCFFADPWWGLLPLAPIRKIGAPYIQETTPANGPPGSASEISFSPDSSALVVTIKGIPGTRMGSTLVYGIDEWGNVKRDPKVSQFANVALPFGFQFFSDRTFYLVDPSFGVALMTINDDLTVTQTIHEPVTGMKAICWSAADLSANVAYAIDAGLNQVFTFDANNLAQTTSIPITQPDGDAGIFDSTVGDGKLYALGSAAGVVVIDVASKTQTGFIDLSQVAPRQYLDGMAYWQCD